MSLGFKRERSESKSDSETDRSDVTVSGDSLFESEWDELVIRYDHESQRYRVGTASQDKHTRTAKSTI